MVIMIKIMIIITTLTMGLVPAASKLRLCVASTQYGNLSWLTIIMMRMRIIKMMMMMIMIIMIMIRIMMKVSLFNISSALWSE